MQIAARKWGRWMSDNSPDVVIIGGGVAGCALATVLARNGLEVTVLERETTYHDRVRGEWIAPWGVEEFKRLGLLDILHQHGALTVERYVPYDENWAPAVAEQRALDLTKLLPEISGALCIGHPTICNAFSASAKAAGAQVMYGIKDVKITAGGRPTVSFSVDGLQTQLSARLIVGADGRNSLFQKGVTFSSFVRRPA